CRAGALPTELTAPAKRNRSLPDHRSRAGGEGRTGTVYPAAILARPGRTGRLLAALCACSLLLLAGAAPGLSTAPTTAALDAALTAGLRQTGAPGGQAAIYRCGRLLWSGAAGAKDLVSKRPVMPDTRFVLASVTKMFTGTLIMELVERGKLALDTP